MLLAIDVGNTNLTFGIFDKNDELVSSFRVTTKLPRTSDEYGVLILNMLVLVGAVRMSDRIIHEMIGM